MSPTSGWAWTQTEFRIGTFWDPCIGLVSEIQPFCSQCSHADWDADVTSVQRAKDAYFNLLTGYSINNVRMSSYAQIAYELEVAKEVGVDYVGRSTNPAAFVCPGQPCTSHYGYYVKHEPRHRCPILCPLPPNAPCCYDPIAGDDIDHLRASIGYLRSVDSEHVGYVNVPGIGPIEAESVYDEYLTQVYGDGSDQDDAELVVYNQYPFTTNGVYDRYFLSMNKIRAHANGRPFWATVNSVQHQNQCYDSENEVTVYNTVFLDPDAEQLRFMACCPIAYGAKGLIYFTFEKPADYQVAYCDGPSYNNSYWTFGDAIANDCASVNTQRYDDVTAINHYLTDVLGPVVMSTNNLGAFHKSNAPTGETIEDERLLDQKSTPLVKDVNNDNVLVGVFEHKNNPAQRYALVVNKALTQIAVTVTFWGDRRGKVEKAPRMVGYDGTGSYVAMATQYDACSNTTLVTLDNLEGGEGWLLRLTDVVDAWPPGKNEDVLAAAGRTTATVSWTAKGDDGSSGTATAYDLRYSTSTITEANFCTLPQVSTPAPSSPGTEQCVQVTGLGSCQWYYFALRTIDDDGNISALSNVASAKTKCSGFAEYDCSGGGGVRSQPAQEVAVFSLGPSSPNPAGVPARISYSISRKGMVDLGVYDVAGRLVRRLVSSTAEAGAHEVVWDGRDDRGQQVAAGVYFYRLSAEGRQSPRTLVLLAR